MVSIAAPVIPLPSALFIFFEGSLAGVFGDRKGGWKGALLAGVVVSLITHMGVAVIAGLQEPLLPSGLGVPTLFLFHQLFISLNYYLAFSISLIASLCLSLAVILQLGFVFE